MNTPKWTVRKVLSKLDYTLDLPFADGSQKIYDARPLLEKPIYADLNNITFFLGAKAEYRTVIWSDDVYIAPEHLYESSQSVPALVY